MTMLVAAATPATTDALNSAVLRFMRWVPSLISYEVMLIGVAAGSLANSASASPGTRTQP